MVAGGSDFVDGKKVYRTGIQVREADGKWAKIGELPHPVAEGVSCAVEVDRRDYVFCAGGTDGATAFSDAFLLAVENGGFRLTALPPLPEPVAMGAAAADGTKVYVVAAQAVW